MPTYVYLARYICLKMYTNNNEDAEQNTMRTEYGVYNACLNKF